MTDQQNVGDVQPELLAFSDMPDGLSAAQMEGYRMAAIEANRRYIAARADERQALAHPRINTPCPACHRTSLIIAEGDYLVCGNLECSDPGAIDRLSVPKALPVSDLDELRQKLAAIEHERWSDWQKWMHSNGVWIERDDRQYLCFSETYITHLESQIDTPYDLLTPHEQASDMEQVDRYWPLIEDYIKAEVKVCPTCADKGIIKEDAS